MAKHDDKAKAKTSFLSLPYELRHQIYDDVCSSDIFLKHRPIVISARATDSYTLSPSEHSLLLTSQAINEDLTALLYEQRTFQIAPVMEEDIYGLRCEAFLTHLRPTTAARIGKVTILLFAWSDTHQPFLPEKIDILTRNLAAFPFVKIRINEGGASMAAAKALRWQSWWVRRLPRREDRIREAIEKLSKTVASEEEVCRRIVEAREGLKTVWDDDDEDRVMWMLLGIMPGGYERVTEGKSKMLWKDMQGKTSVSDRSRKRVRPD